MQESIIFYNYLLLYNEVYFTEQFFYNNNNNKYLIMLLLNVLRIIFCSKVSEYIPLFYMSKIFSTIASVISFIK
jgi:hypothetical protein